MMFSTSLVLSLQLSKAALDNVHRRAVHTAPWADSSDMHEKSHILSRVSVRTPSPRYVKGSSHWQYVYQVDGLEGNVDWSEDPRWDCVGMTCRRCLIGSCDNRAGSEDGSRR
nr:hypothetical protein CFP56_43817 [Quercus suber]